MRTTKTAISAYTPQSGEFGRIRSEFLLETLAAERYKSNHLLQFLLRLFHDDLENVADVCKKYFLGTGQRGETIFWQIDERLRIRTGKMIVYDPRTGKRRKDSNPNWVHAVLKRDGKLPESFELRQCFFGQHLLRHSRTAPIAIAESEKTAVIAAIHHQIFPEMIWLATGGKSNLSVKRLLEIAEGRRVLLYPDVDAIEAWSNVAEAGRLVGLDIRVSQIVNQIADMTEAERGLDLADCLITIRQNENSIKFCESLNDLDLADEIRKERMAIMTIDGGLSELAAADYVLRHCRS